MKQTILILIHKSVRIYKVLKFSNFLKAGNRFSVPAFFIFKALLSFTLLTTLFSYYSVKSIGKAENYHLQDSKIYPETTNSPEIQKNILEGISTSIYEESK